MDRSSLAPPARAVRIAGALALALALAAVFGSAPASAAVPTTVKLTCAPLEPVAGETVTCKTGLSSPDGPPRGGTIRFEALGFADLGTRTCKPILIFGGESICVFKFRVTAPGSTTLFATYQDATHEFGSAEQEFFVGGGGSIRVECSPEFGFADELSDCEAFVPNTPGALEAPTGSVHFRAETEFNSEPHGFIEPECTLEPSPGGARCSVVFFPRFEANIAIVADYEGDASHPAQFGSVIYLVFEQHETRLDVSCNPSIPNTATPTTCTATVVNLDETGGAPTGDIEFEHNKDNLGVFLGPDFMFCRLKAVDPKDNESSCQVRFQPRFPGPETFDVVFKGSDHFVFDRTSIDFEVVAPRKTATGLLCLPNRSSVGICLATVTDTSASPVKPTGTVKLNVPAGVNLNRETCDLLPSSTAGTSSCAFSYTMDAVGSAPVVAEYSGANAGLLPSSGKGTASRPS